MTRNVELRHKHNSHGFTTQTPDHTNQILWHFLDQMLPSDNSGSFISLDSLLLSPP